MLKIILLLLVAFAAFSNGKLLGEPESAEVHESSDTDFFEHLAEEALRRINYESHDINYWKLGKIVDSDKQVVNGIRYKFQFTSTKTECNKEEDKERIALGLCAIREDAPTQICHFEVLVREWESSQEFINRGCLHQRTKLVDHHQHKLQNNLDTKIIDKTAEKVYKISKHIKPKDFGAWNLFTGFIERHSKTYESKKEILRRFRIYKRNIRAAKVFQKQELGTAIYGETEFMDLTPTEFKKIYLPYQWEKPAFKVRQLSASEIEDEEIPKSYDSRTKGLVTDVKNQGQCGSCWAFSVTGNIEGQWAKKTGKLISLSEQELVDCDVVDQGCNGGLPLNAYKEIIRMGGLEPEKDYPYDGKKETCHLARKDIAVFINDSLQLPTDEGKMAIWLFKNGPISIGINANPLQFYRHGISHPWKIFCSPMMLNHGVLIVGYGQEGDKPFWIIKNSWGPKWGEEGYYRLYRGKNVCGVNQMATSSIVH
jgi:cathepsin F